MAKKDPKTGTGKKPKGSGRRLYTEELISLMLEKFKSLLSWNKGQK